MKQTNFTYILDIGNTSFKLVLIENEEITQFHRFQHIDDVKRAIQYSISSPLIVSSVRSDSETSELLKNFSSVFLIDHSTPTPIKTQYNTGETLGMDRLCNAVYVNKHMSTEYGVCIDIGTCIKFDLVSSSEGYLGGSISPGIDLRYKALNDYTGKLPLLDKKQSVGLVGTSTKGSISSGVMNGIHAEIQGMVNAYSEQFDDLTFFMTGGDAVHFDIHTKNDIFADEKITLKGLYEIYLHNA